MFTSLEIDVRLRWGLECSILNGQVINVENSKLNTADM